MRVEGGLLEVLHVRVHPRDHPVAPLVGGHPQVREQGAERGRVGGDVDLQHRQAAGDSVQLVDHRARSAVHEGLRHGKVHGQVAVREGATGERRAGGC